MSLLISMPKACASCCAMRGQPTRGLRRLISTIASMSSFDGPFGPGRLMTSRREEPPILAFLERLVEPEQGSGLQDDRELRGIRAKVLPAFLLSQTDVETRRMCRS